MLPWTEQILLADLSKSNVLWLQDQLADIKHPREQLRDACASEEGAA